MKVCPSCQQENPLSANFCNQCGTNLSNPELLTKAATSERKRSKKRAAERRQLTILFCDLVGSTPLSEQLDPEEFRQIITSYHEIAEKVIERFGGYIAQYLGDGLLVYFGYPEGMEFAPKLSIQAGLGILKEMATYNKENLRSTNQLNIRIGIHTGLVVVDEHLALGETVNTAARLEGIAPHNQVVISPQTLKLVQGWFEVKSVGKRTLKGISEPMEVYQVIGESDATTRLDIAKKRGLSPLVGRTRELQLLNAFWEKTKQGKGHLVLLNGEAGIGKSRLVDTIEVQVAEQEDNWIGAARCSANQKNSVFYPIIELLERDVFDINSSDSVEIKLQKLHGFLKSSSLDIQTTIPLLAEFLAIPLEKYPPLVISPIAKKQRIIETISKVILEKVSEKTGVLVVEDLHWADASTLEWLNLFVKNISSHAVLILCTTRPNFKPEWTENPDFDQIDLERLQLKDITEICQYQSRGKILPDRILELISSKTEGVPLFVEELSKMIVESDLLTERENEFELKGKISSLAIPSTLQDSLLARLDRLSIEKDIVQIGSVIGYEFSLAMLNAMLPDEISYLEDSISQLLEAEILFQQDAGEEKNYQFKHALIQDAAYESLLKSRRQELHKQVAEVIEKRFEETTKIQPELLAHHYTASGQYVSAIPYWLEAGKMACQKNANAEAIAHLQNGIDLLHHIKNDMERNNLELDFMLTLGGAFVVFHGFPHPKVKETFNRARDIAQNIDISPKQALVLFNLLSYYFNTEDYKAHQELSDHMLNLAKDSEHGYWFDLFANQVMGCALTVQGDFKVAKESFKHVLERFDPSIPFPWELAPSGYIEVGAKSWHMICLQLLGYMDQAKSLRDEHLAYLKDHSDSMTLYHTYTFPALCSLEAREWKYAQDVLEKYLPIVRNFGDPIFNLTAEVYYNVAKSYQGDKSAFDTAFHLVNVCFDVGFKAFATTMSPFLAELFILSERYDAALEWIEKILDHVHASGTNGYTSELLRLKGHAFNGLEKSDQAVEDCYRQAMKIARNQSAKIFELRATCDLAILWKKNEKSHEALSLLNGIIYWFKEGKDSIDLKIAGDLLEELKLFD